MKIKEKKSPNKNGVNKIPVEPASLLNDCSWCKYFIPYFIFSEVAELLYDQARTNNSIFSNNINSDK